MSLNCIIIDDEPLAINVIKNHISKISHLDIKASFNNAVEALEFMRSNTTDVIFLDIDMPVLDGLSFLKTLEKKPTVIITTAHEEFAVKGYELDVFDYLIKPIPFPRFLKAIDKLKRMRQNSSKENEYLFIKIGKKKMKKIYLNDIILVESLKDYIRVITRHGKYVVHQTLSSFTDSLPPRKFLRIHRSYTISIDKVEALEGNSVEINGSLYVIGRSYLNEAKIKILNFR